MAKVQNTQAPIMVAPQPVKTVTPVRPNTSLVDATPRTYMFGKKNYLMMVVGMVVIGIGFALMSGGKSADPHVFNADELYSFRRITLAPIVVLLGFVIEGIAIMWIPKEEN
jgi:Protein of unknown function (DUF3098)